MPEGTLTLRWENGRISSEIISTGYILEQPSGISISCCRLKVDDRDDLVLYFERMELRRDGFHLWLAGFVYTIPVAEGTGFTLELIEPVPVQMSRPLNPRLMSTSDYCYVHVFLLSNNSHFKTLKAKWMHIPSNARMEERLGAIVQRMRFRYLVGQALSDPFTITEIFENRNIFESVAAKSFVLYMHDQNAVPFRFQGRYVTTEGLPDICQSAAMSAIRRDPELKNQDIRWVATIAMSGGLALDKLNAIGWNSRNYPSEALDWSQAFSPNVVEADVLSKYQGACQTFIEHKPLESLNERSLCQSSWYRIVQDGLSGSGLLIRMEWSPSGSYDLDDSRSVDVGFLDEAGDALLLLECALEESPPGTDHKDYLKLETIVSIACRKKANRLIEQGRSPLSVRCYGMLIGGRGAQLLTAKLHYRTINGKRQLHVRISKEEAWYIDLVNGPDFDQITPSTADTFNDYANNLFNDPRLNNRSLLAIDWFLGRVRKTNADIQKAPSFAPRSYDSASLSVFEVGSLDPAVIPCSTRGTTKEAPLKYCLAQVTHHPTGSLRNHQPTQDLTFTLQKYLIHSELELFKSLHQAYPLSFPHLLEASVDETSGTVQYTFERMYPATDSQRIGINDSFFQILYQNLTSSTSCCRFIQDAFELLLGASVGLHILHEKISMVHSDVTPSNVMYSWLHGCWKLIDLEQVQPIEYSLKTPRLAGTQGFCDLQAENTRIFTKANDVHALGCTIQWIFYRIFGHLQHSTVEQEKCVDLIVRVAAAMTSFEAQDRPSVQFCIELAVNALSWPWFNILPGSERIIEYAKELLTEKGQTLVHKTVDDYLALFDPLPSDDWSESDDDFSHSMSDIETTAIEVAPKDPDEAKVNVRVVDLEENADVSNFI